VQVWCKFEKVSAKQKEGSWGVLVPKKLPSGRWMVSLGWVDGKNPRRKFATKDDAQAFCLLEKARRKAHGQLTADADGELVARWMKLEERLKTAGAGSLVAVAEKALRDHAAITRTGTARECFDMAHAALKAAGRKGNYLADLRNRCGRFLRDFGENRPIAEATPAVVSAFLGNIKDGSGSYRRTISAWLGWAADNGWLATNPCIRKRRRGEKTKGQGKAVILSPEESAKMLMAAVESEAWDVLGYVTLSLFAGIRPEEFRKRAKGFPPLDLRWEDIDNKHISINEELAKTGRGRSIPASAVLEQWLELLRIKKGGKLSGNILPPGWVKLWSKWRKEHWVDAGGVPLKWHADQLRHSFGSYHLAAHRNAGRTALVMGNSATILLDRYWNWKTLASTASVYWKLAPASSVDEMLSFAKKNSPV
jgi:integrase